MVTLATMNLGGEALMRGYRKSAKGFISVLGSTKGILSQVPQSVQELARTMMQWERKSHRVLIKQPRISKYS